MKLLLLAVMLGLAGAYPLEDPKECQPHSRPWHVSLDGQCSGALIDKWWIVTSHECALYYNTMASLGEHAITVEEGTEQHIAIADTIIHSPYRSPFNSLAMLRLAEPAQLNQYVQPVPLPTRCPKPGETCSVSGWGSTIPNQHERSPGLKCITVPVVDDLTCLNSFPPMLHWGVMVCAGQANTDNCLNDRSSVMVCGGELQGLLWFNFGCDNPANPTVYSKMCEYNRWIKNVMEHYTTDPLLTTTVSPLDDE
ncbi:trypsinogen-like protein 3 [Kryptolebias marmoratus]|uniref:Trypsinogen-like protein 3 n=1 Tax=Kryptolebias marmoratus TaxID=37003 RepID=A0A3Q3AJ99_KRYMA|nr:trypsinogen-like protein 3 [Kryptolebias marmoratus]